jgi:hypothetical protein
MLKRLVGMCDSNYRTLMNVAPVALKEGVIDKKSTIVKTLKQASQSLLGSKHFTAAVSDSAGLMVSPTLSAFLTMKSIVLRKACYLLKKMKV